MYGFFPESLKKTRTFVQIIFRRLFVVLENYTKDGLNIFPFYYNQGVLKTITYMYNSTRSKRYWKPILRLTIDNLLFLYYKGPENYSTMENYDLLSHKTIYYV